MVPIMVEILADLNTSGSEDELRGVVEGAAYFDGGVAAGVASEEPACQGVDEWKRKRLIGVAADYIVPNYLCGDELLASLFRAS